MRGRSKRGALGAAGLCLSLVAAACGGGSAQPAVPGAHPGGRAVAGGGHPGTTAPGIVSTGIVSTPVATARADAARYEVVPTSIVQTTPLPARPSPKKVAFVECGDPDCANLAAYLQQSTAALGWTLTTFAASTSNPGAAVQQAINSGADYLAVTGTPIAAFPRQLAEMKAKGIPLFECYSTDVPAGAANDVYADCDDASAAAVYANAMADYVVADAGGTANVVTISIPTYAILTAQSEAFASTVASRCSTCSLDAMNVTVSDVATGAVPNQVVAYLETHPQVSYVFVTLSRIEAGISAALKAAGLAGKVKVVGTEGHQSQFQEIVDGASSVWSAVPEPLSMWTLADQMARLSVHAWSLSEERQAALTPFYLVTSADRARPLAGLPLGWPGPAGYQDDFKRLWGV